MSDQRVVALFPGQGAFYAGALAQSYDTYPQIRDTFADVDAVAARHLEQTVSDVILRPDPPGIQELLAGQGDLLQLAIYGVSVATYRVLEAHGLRAAVHVGHSFGEIAALVCAGAFTVAEGAEIVCHRVAALRALGTATGRMVALSTDAHRAQRMLELLGDPRAVAAAENHDAQTVVSGPDEAIEAVEGLAGVLRIPAVPLKAPYAFHGPLMAPAVDEFAGRLRQLRPRPLRQPVYSPILERTYGQGDDLAQCLAGHLTQPVRFGPAIRRLHDQGAAVFVECGALHALGKIVHRVLHDARPVTLTCLDPAAGDAHSLQSAIDNLRSRDLLAPVVPAGLGAALLPQVAPEAFDAFWTARGRQVLEAVRAEFAAFTGAQSAPHLEAAPDPSPPSTPAQQSEQLEPAPAPVLSEAATAPRQDAPSAPATREALFRDLAAMYATALEYPEEVFTEEVALEAELGVDSVKQTELMARVVESYGLPPRPADFRMADYDTMGKITDLVWALMQRAPAEAVAAPAAPAAPAALAAPLMAEAVR
ncbi:MAG: acyltransferase domain-containing protein [Chloroflexota bacterium]